MRYIRFDFANEIFDSKVFPVGEESEKLKSAATQTNRLLRTEFVRIKEFECDCLEKAESQESFTRDELRLILSCPAKHTL